jgi:predicted transposase/invertase (TIGR01784 family)
MPANLLDTKNDYVFKRLLADSPPLLSALINAVRYDQPPIQVVRVLNPTILPDELQRKAIVLDVLAQDAFGHRFDIEMQARRHPDWIARSVYYASRMLGQQLADGEPYSALRPAIGIHLLDFDLIDRLGRALWRFHLREDHEPDLKLSDEIELNVVELRKARGLRDLPRAISNWVTFFEQWNEEAAMAEIDDVSVREARRRLEVISGDEEERIRAELREKAVRDEISLIEWERKQGIAGMLARQLAQRFGELSPNVKARLQSADLPTLERWIDRILVAKTLDEVFAER